MTSYHIKLLRKLRQFNKFQQEQLDKSKSKINFNKLKRSGANLTLLLTIIERVKISLLSDP